MPSSQDISSIITREMNARLGHRLRKLILFGSMARKDGTPESDFDCIAVIDDLAPDVLDAIDDISGELLYEYNAVVAVIPLTEARYRSEKFNPLLINAARDGMVLWPKAG
mgnify:CR=1 FL=1